MHPDLLTWIGVAIIAAAFFWWKRADLDRNQAHELVAGGALLVDVRSPAEFASGHIDGARNVPVGEIAQRVSELGATDRPVIVYCASGTRSAMAKRTLTRAGFARVYNLGSMRNW
jgi:rhodanese-related sulfurtransferase